MGHVFLSPGPGGHRVPVGHPVPGPPSPGLGLKVPLIHQKIKIEFHDVYELHAQCKVYWAQTHKSKGRKGEAHKRPRKGPTGPRRKAHKDPRERPNKSPTWDYKNRKIA